MKRHCTQHYDTVVVGAGIVGIAHALAAARGGRTVALLESSARAVGASIRNFGFVTVTGQERHEMWPLANRSRDCWAAVAPQAGIAIEQTGLMLLARRDEAAAVLEEFMGTEMGEGCKLASHSELSARFPDVPFEPFQAALISSRDIRVEARTAIPKLARWLVEKWGVEIFPNSTVVEVTAGNVVATTHAFSAETIFVCPGSRLSVSFPDLAKEMGVQPCKLQMLRLAAPGYTLPSPVMSDLGLDRYQGYSTLPAAEALSARLRAEQAAQCDAGVHLIAVQSADGSLVVGDSHDYDDPLDPVQQSHIDDLILEEFQQVFGTAPQVKERWIGTYAWSADKNWFSREVQPGLFVTVVTCGAGMSTAFAIAEDVVSGAFNRALKGWDQ